MSDPYQPVYLDSAEQAERFLAALRADIIAEAASQESPSGRAHGQIAVDTEGASFHRFIDRIYLLQLSSRENSAIIDPLHAGTLPGLGTLLEDRGIEVVFHDADYDLRLLRQDYGWQVTHVFDTRIAAQLIGLRAFGLAALLEHFFNIKLDKTHQRADWSLRPLTPSMLDYAAQDTRYLLDLRDELATALDKLGRMAWAEEEFARLEHVQFAEDDSESAFLRIKGSRELDRRGLALLRELVGWRDALARTLDKAAFRVVGNEALVEIARLAPRAASALGSLKGLSRTVLSKHADEIIAAVSRGLEVSESELPRFPKRKRWDRDPEFEGNVSKLKAIRDRAAERLEIDPGILCGRERLEAIARRRPATVDELKDIPDLRRWQIEVLGTDLVAALR